MTEDDDTQYLEDLNVRHIRAENDEVDETMSDLEAEVERLEAEVDDKEETISDLRDEKETYEELVSDFREGQRNEYLDRIREANEAVSEDDEVDLSAFEDADPDTLRAVAEQVERLAEAANAGSVSNDKPDLSDVSPDDDEIDDLEAAKREAAKEAGLLDAYERIQNGETAGVSGVGKPANSPAGDLEAKLDQLVGGDS